MLYTKLNTASTKICISNNKDIEQYLGILKEANIPVMKRGKGPDNILQPSPGMPSATPGHIIKHEKTEQPPIRGRKIEVTLDIEEQSCQTSAPKQKLCISITVERINRGCVIY